MNIGSNITFSKIRIDLYDACVMYRQHYCVTKDSFPLTTLRWTIKVFYFTYLFILHIHSESTQQHVVKEERRFTPIFRPATCLVAFVVVLVAPRSGGYVLVYVRVASPLAQAASTQSQ